MLKINLCSPCCRTSRNPPAACLPSFTPPFCIRALRRKIGGTAKDYWKDWVEVDTFDNTYHDPEKSSGTVPYLPLLVAVVVGMLAATVAVVEHTSG